MQPTSDSVRARRPTRLTRASVVCAALLILASSLSACSSPAAVPVTTVTVPTVPVPTVSTPKTLAVTYLHRYVTSDGRVVRWDQGGDTVSEGQGYGLLLAVAARQAATFASLWTWTKDNLIQPDGLPAYLWANGAVVGSGSATDADLITAWALVLGAKVFGDPSYLRAARSVANAILVNETVIAGGRIELVAGPWARNAPYPVDPSYFSPQAMTALAVATHDDRWSQLGTNSQQLVADLQDSGASQSLPPDWALLQTTGTIAASPAPSGGVPPSYGLDAQRLPVWYAADCTVSGRTLSANDWSIIGGLAGSGAYGSYSLTGTPRVSYTNDLGLVAAAASADAARQLARGKTLLALAQHGFTESNYYGDSWVALGTVLLTSSLLSSCPPAPAT